MKNYFRKNTAQRHVCTKVPTVLPTELVGNVVNLVRNNIKAYDTIHYVFIIDHNNILKGVVSLKELFLAKPEEKVSEIMKTEIVKAHPHSTMEHVIRNALKHGIKAIPIVDHDNIFLGIINADTLFQSIQQEHTADILHGVGVHMSKDMQDGVLSGGFIKHIRQRIPWLLFGLLGGVLAASIIEHFEILISGELLIAAFIPLLVYISDSVGSQSQVLYIRTLALKGKFDLFEYLMRESMVVMGIGIIIGLAIFSIVALIFGHPLVGFVIGLAVFASTTLASILSILISIIFEKINIDPAIASGPFATILSDVMSLLIYFGIAHIILATV